MKRTQKNKKLLCTRIFFCISSLTYLSSTATDTNQNHNALPSAKKTRNPFAFRSDNTKKYLGQGFIDIEGASRKNIVVYERVDNTIERVEFIK